MSIALVTPSCAADYEQCRLLVETTNRCIHRDIPHYLIIDRRDVPRFQSLTSPRTRILVSEAMLPAWLAPDPAHRHQWTSARTPPVVNWVIQQLLKLSVFDAIPEDLVVFCDSDMAFVRPFDLIARVVHPPDRISLLRVEQNPGPQWTTWREAAFHLLGLQEGSGPVIDYIGNMITWQRKHVLALRARIEAIHGRPWIEAVARCATLSEYILYGTYIEHVVGLEDSGHIIDNHPAIKASWGTKLNDADALQRFFQYLEPGIVGVMIHSRDAVPVARYREHVLSLIQTATPRGGPPA